MNKENLNIKQREKEIIDYIYEKKCFAIHQYKCDELENAEKNKNRCKNTLLCFLKENLSFENYEIALDYINSLKDSQNKILEVENKIFYIEGLRNGIEKL